MKQLKVILAILAILILLLLPMAALADNATESTVADGLAWGEGINGNFAHNSWYSAGRHWVMYVYGDDVICGSSADYGATWDYIAVTSGAQTIFRGLAVWYDEGTNLVHYARIQQQPGNITDGDIVYHRAGTPNAVGTITWAEAEVATEYGSSDALIGTVAITCDRDGYPYIAWTEDEYDGGNLTGHYWVEVNDSTENDGTWIDNDAWQEFDGTAMSGYGHDYDTLYGDGNWTAIVVSLVPIEGAGSARIHLAWSLLETNGTDTVGIDSTIYDQIAGWGNCSWVVPPDPTNGLFTDVMGEIAFSFYNLNTTVYCVYGDWIGDLLYNAKSGATDWEDINGIGNWTRILDSPGYNMPAIAGYSDSDDLIVVYHDRDSLYYDTKPSGGAFTGTWTLIWDIDDHTVSPAHDIFLHNMQYRYGAGSPVGFAWDWGTLEWGNTSQSGTLSYWFIDKDGVAGGENPLGWYSSGVITSTWLTVLFKTLLSIAIACGIVIGTLKFEMAWQPKLAMIAMGLMLIAIVNSLL